MVERVLGSGIIDDDIALYLPIFTKTKALRGKPLIGRHRIYLLSDLEAAHDILVKVWQLACDEEEMVALIELFSYIRPASTQRRVWPEVRVLYCLPTCGSYPLAVIMIFPAIALHSYVKLLCVFPEFHIEVLLKGVPLKCFQYAVMLKTPHH